MRSLPFFVLIISPSRPYGKYDRDAFFRRQRIIFYDKDRIFRIICYNIFMFQVAQRTGGCDERIGFEIMGHSALL